MRMYDIIERKRDGKPLSKQEIDFFIKEYTENKIPDYQASTLLMAIFLNGMNNDEIANLTNAMACSGDMVDLSAIKGIKVDKHSTGGVGDKTTLVITPIVASCGVPIAKMSGRGLGHTGGTVDKMEAIPGLQTAIDRERFFEIVNTIGISVVGQSGNLAPADKKLYALRDVTATVDCIPLIASSIMSKKIAAGSDCILLDVKTGNGAFMKTIEDSIKLAKQMVNIGDNVGRKTVALITDMDIPLGYAVGNSLEVVEAIDTLNGKGPKDLTDVCIELAANMLYLAEKGDMDYCTTLVQDAIKSGKALEKLKQMVEMQGGDVLYVEDTNKFKVASILHPVKAKKQGFVSHMQTELCGIASVVLGAGRETKESTIDFSAGIVFQKKFGDYVEVGDTLAVLHTNFSDKIVQVEKMILDAFKLSEKKPQEQKLIYARIEKDTVQLF